MKKSITLFLSVIVLVSLLLSQSGVSASGIPPADELKPPRGEPGRSEYPAGLSAAIDGNVTAAGPVTGATGASGVSSIPQASADAGAIKDNLPPVPGAQQDGKGRWFMNYTVSSGATPAPQAASATGGPDEFGYTWTDHVHSSYISALTDTGMSGNSEYQAVNVTLPFTFPYYERYVDEIYIAASGYLVMGGSEYWPWQEPIVTPRDPNDIIAPYWSPFFLSDVSGGGNRVYYDEGGSFPNRFFVAEWYEVAGGFGDTYSFEVILFENGTIEFHYSNIDIPDGRYCGSTGIEDSTGRIGLKYLGMCDDPNQLRTNTAIRFTRPASAANLDIYPRYQGQFINPGNSIDFLVPIRNNGDLGPDCYDLNLSSTWTVELYDNTYTPLADTCGNSSVDTGSINQPGTFEVIVRIIPDEPVSLGDHETTELTATSTIDGAVSKTAYLSAASPAPFVQALDYTRDAALDLEYIQPLAQYILNASQPQGMNSWSPSVARGPNFYVYAWDNDRCSQPDCQYNYSEIYVAITDFQGRLLYPLRKVTDHSFLTGNTFDRMVVPVVTADGNIGLTWFRELRDYESNTFNGNIFFALLSATGTTILPPTQITANDAWGREWEDGGISLDSSEVIAYDSGRFLITWNQTIWQSGANPIHDVFLAVRDADGSQLTAPTQITSGDVDNHYYHASQTWLEGADLSFLSYIHNGQVVFRTLDDGGNTITGETHITTGGDGNNPDAIQLSTGEILIGWEEIGLTRQLNYAVFDGTSYTQLVGQTELTNDATGYNQFVSITRDDAGHGILTWQDGETLNLYYALVNHDGDILTEPMVFHNVTEPGYNLWTSQSGSGNAPLTIAVEKSDLWVFSEDSTGYKNSQLRIPVYYKNFGQSVASDVQLSITLDDTPPYDDGVTYNWDTSGIPVDYTDGVLTWSFEKLGYLEGGEFDLFINIPWEAPPGEVGPWTVPLQIQSSSSEAYPADNLIEITISSTPPPQGDPDTVFRYEDTFGVLHEPYPVDEEHFFGPSGITSDASNNIYMVEESGFRLWKNPQNGAARDWVVGTPGYPWHHKSYLSYPGDVAVEPVSGHAWVVMNNSVKEFDSAGNVIQTLPAENPWEGGQDNYRFASRPLGVAFDKDGRMFVADSNNQRIQVYHFTSDTIPAPEYEATIGVTGEKRIDNSGFNWPTRIALDSNYNLYVMDSWNNRVQRCYEESPASWSCSTFFGITGEWGAADDPQRLGLAVGIAVDSSDNIYIADSINNRLFKCDTAEPPSCSIFTEGSGSGPGQYSWLNDIAIDSAGYVYITDSGNSRMQILDSSGDFVDMVGVTGEPYVITEGYYNSPVGIDVDSAGNMLIVEQLGLRMIKTDAAGNQLWTVGGPTSDVFGLNGPQSNPSFAPDGLIYVSDPDNNRVLVFDSSDGSQIVAFGNGGQGNWEFQGPMGIDTRVVGDHYETFIADAWNHRIQVYDNNGYKTTIGWTGVSGFDDRHFNGPRDVAVTADGIVYVADSDNQRIMKCTTEDGYAYACSVFFGVTSESRLNGDYFVHLNQPISVDVDVDGKVYVADEWGNRVQVISPDGEYLTTIGMLIGPELFEPWDTGTGEMNNPRGVAIDANGNVLVVDQFNHRIQKFAPGVEGWHQVNLNGFGWTDTYGVFSGTWFNGIGYAGTNTDWGAQVWRLDPLDWSQEMTAFNGFFDGNNLGIDHMLVYQGQIYASTFNVYSDDSGDHSNGGQIWRSPSGDFSSWEKVVSDGSGNTSTPDPANSEFYRMFTLENPVRICATTWAYASVHAAEIWCSESGDYDTWTSLLGSNYGFGDGANAGFISTEYLAGDVYVGTNNGNTGGEVWRSDDHGATWTQINTDGFGDIANSIVSGMATLDGYLYAVTHHANGAGSEVWRCQVCDNSDWEQVVDNGLGLKDSRRMPAIEAINGRLVLVLGGNYTGIKIYASESGDEDSWVQIAPDGLGDSNNITPYFDNSLVGYMNHIFLGTMNNGNGGELWMSNEAPKGSEDHYSTPVLETLVIDAMDGVLRNDSDFESDMLSVEVVDGPSSSQGILDEFNADGSFVFTPAPGFTGDVTFTYRIFDGIDYSDPVTVTIYVTHWMIYIPVVRKP
jgi:sugar lactone lactonase YvrE